MMSRIKRNNLPKFEVRVILENIFSSHGYGAGVGPAYAQ
jgi:hypothetical protein